MLPASILAAALIIGGAWVWTSAGKADTPEQADLAKLEAKVVPTEGKVIPIRWGDLGKRLVESGVINREKFDALYAERGGLNDDERALLESADNGDIRITPNNAAILLNVFWALGLGNSSEVLDNGMMQDEQFGGAGGFASTGGWSLATGDAMDHYSRHRFMTLTADQHAMVKRVANGIYRPCCDNPTSFPDCNHGMAMLGLLELMASQGASEEQMYRTALDVNAYWFPDTYMTIAQYLESRGTPWAKADPKTVLGKEYSSASGSRRISAEVAPVQQKGGGGCGV